MDERTELERRRIVLSQYQRWLSEFPDISLVLENMAAEIDGKQSLDACHPPGPAGPWDVTGLRETLRRRRTP
jgi:hypothetical protein